MHTMNHPYRFIIGFLLIAATALAGCKATKPPQTASADPMPSTWVSEQDRLRSTVMLIEASKQKVLGNISQATVLYHDAITVDPGNDAAHFELAKIHAMKGQFDDALSFAKKAVSLSPENHHYQLVLADIFILTNNIADAIVVYEDLLRKHPDNVEYAYSLASAYLYNNQKEKAFGMLEYIEHLVGFSEEISIEKQKILVEQQQFDRAIEEAKKLVSLFPGQRVYYEILADLYRETGQLEEAGKLYRSMLETNPADPMANLLMANYYIEKESIDEAFTYLLKAFQSPEIDAEGKATIIYRYYLLSEDDPRFLEQALTLSEMLIDMHPDDPESYLIYGDFLNREQRHKEAREAFLKATTLDPSRVEVWQQILSLDGRLSDFESMRKHAEQALEYFFEQPILFLFNGLANLQLKEYHEAASSFEYGLALSQANPDLKADFLSLLGDTYHYLGRHEQSDQYYEQVLTLNPDNATVLNNYSYHLAVRKERLDEALKMSEKALRFEPDNAAFLDTYGWILYQMGRYQEARTYIERAIAKSSEPSAVILEHLGDVLYRLNEKEKALHYWEKALQAGEGSEWLERKVNDRTLYE